MIFPHLCHFVVLFFLPLFGQFYHHHPNQNENSNSLKTTTQLAWSNKQTKKPTPALNPTHQPEPSGPPQDVKCYSSSSTNILVSWQPPPIELQNGIITRYTIQYAATEGEDTTAHQISSIPPESSHYLLENLDKWTEYRVTVTAHTDVGAGPESLPQLIRTEEDGMCSLQPLLQISPSYPAPVVLTATTPSSSSLPPHSLLIRLSPAETFSPVLDFWRFFFLPPWTFAKAPFWLFPWRCSISTHGMAF